MSQGNIATFVTQSVPAQMTAGLIYNVSVTMKNTGTTARPFIRINNLGFSCSMC